MNEHPSELCHMFDISNACVFISNYRDKIREKARKERLAKYLAGMWTDEKGYKVIIVAWDNHGRANGPSPPPPPAMSSLGVKRSVW